MQIPEWFDCKNKTDNGEELTPLERFVYDQEPSEHHGDEEWREQLQAVVDSLK